MVKRLLLGAIAFTCACSPPPAATGASHLKVSGVANPVTAGVEQTVTLTAVDTMGATVTTYAGTVHVGTDSANATLPADATFSASDNGVKTVKVTFKTATPSGMTATLFATDTADSNVSGTQSGITVVAATAASLVVTAPTPQAAGTAFQVGVSAKDAFGNAASAYAGTLHFTSSDAQATLPSDAPASAGALTSSVTLSTAGMQTITVTDAANASITGTTSPITVTGGSATATHLLVVANANAVAGAPFSVTVSARDANEGLVSTYAGMIALTSSDTQAVLPSNLSLSGGMGTFTAVTLKTVGVQTVTATDAAIAGVHGTSSSITVNAAAASTLVVTGPSTATSGTAFMVTVTAKDAFGNVDSAYAGVVQLTSTDAQAVLPANMALTAGTGIFAVTLKTNGAQTVTATDASDSAVHGTSPNISVTTSALPSFTVSAPTSATAGATFSITVTAKDGSGNIDAAYAGTVHFTSTDTQAVLPANVTLTAGAGTFNTVALKTVGTQTLSVSDTVMTTRTGTTSNITVNAGAATSFSVIALSNTTAGVAMSVTVSARDAFNNVATSYAGTVHFTSTDGQATLPANATLSSGSGMFNATLKTSGTQTLTATDTVTASITGASPNITVNAGAAASFSVVAASGATAGTPFNVTVTAKDGFNNIATGYAGTVHFTSTDTQAVLPADSTLTAGTKTFTNGATLKVAGTQTLTVNDTANGAITGTSANITVSAGSAKTFSVSGFTATFTGVLGNLNVQALDAFGNVASGYVGTVTFTSNGAGATVPANYTFTVGDAGTHFFSNSVMFASSGFGLSVTATDTVTSSITGSLPGVFVPQGPNLFGLTATLIVGGTRAGQIFVAGGSTTAIYSGAAMTATWFYNPITGALSAGPAMATARAFHTATALGSGLVLIGGGPNPLVGDRELELCALDGASPSCSFTGGALKANRCHAAAALISATRVLIAGGDDCSGGPALSSWLVWDSTAPSAPTANTAGNGLTAGRQLFTATSLGSNTVLLAGGASSASADRFIDGLPPTVAATSGSMSTLRTGHSATLLPVGMSTSCPTPGSRCVLIAGGGPTSNNSWEIYDSLTTTFPRNSAAAGHDLVDPLLQVHVAGVFANGKVLLAGGNDGVAVNTTESFDPAAATLRWNPAPAMGFTRYFHAGVLVTSQDVLYLFGGNVFAPAIEALAGP